MKMKEILKTKTFYGGLGAVLSAVAGFATGEMELAQALNLAFTGLIGIFIRDGLLKQS